MNQDVIDLMNQVTAKDKEIVDLNQQLGTYWRAMRTDYQELVKQLVGKDEEIKVLKFRESNVTAERDVANLEIERLNGALKTEVEAFHSIGRSSRGQFNPL